MALFHSDFDPPQLVHISTCPIQENSRCDPGSGPRSSVIAGLRSQLPEARKGMCPAGQRFRIVKQTRGITRPRCAE